MYTDEEKLKQDKTLHIPQEVHNLLTLEKERLLKDENRKISRVKIACNLIFNHYSHKGEKIEIQEELPKEEIRIKKNSSEFSSHIQEILNIFYKINPTLNFGNKTQRKSIEEMISKFGIEKTIKMAEYAISIYSEPFAPTITTPYQLKEKVAQLISYWQRNQNINNSKGITIL